MLFGGAFFGLLAFLEGPANREESPDGEPGGNETVGDEEDDLPYRRFIAEDVRYISGRIDIRQTFSMLISANHNPRSAAMK